MEIIRKTENISDPIARKWANLFVLHQLRVKAAKRRAAKVQQGGFTGAVGEDDSECPNHAEFGLLAGWVGWLV